MKTLSTLIILFFLQTMVSQVIIGGVPEHDANGNPIFKAMLEIRNPKAPDATKSGILIPRYASINLPTIPTEVADETDTETDETVNWDGMMIYNTTEKKFMYVYQEEWYILP
jgi:hypothetical protein